ncbi:phosphopantetheine-binding protein [Dactylosporangium sp. CA-139114]|uniref:phosphopantetheine-binding protein n=1 Tax=Dactylosporangium sp. CA-139114 TaxID=3239931 RepID=UPI003D984A72
MAEAAGIHAVDLVAAHDSPAGAGIITALGELWTGGQPVDVTELCGGGRPAHLPGYPFAGPRWIAPETLPAPAPGTAPAAPAATATERPAAAPEHPQPAAAGRPEPAEVVSQLWAELLGHRALDPDADFFALGGDSLTVTHLARRINQALGIKVPLRDLLAGRTLGRQRALVAEHIAQLSTQKES